MILAKVTKRVVATEKSSRIPAVPMQEVVPLPGYGDGTPFIALAGVEAGPGDTVLINQEGSGAREALQLGEEPLPCQMVIVGIVDQIDLNSYE